MLLIGVIPDMRVEPKTNTFLKPLVEELILLGVKVFSCSHTNRLLYPNVLNLL